MAKVYTKTGDKGETSLLNGERVSKTNTLITTYGELDMLNAYLGLISSKFINTDMDQEFITSIQRNIFSISSYISCPKNDRETYKIKIIPSNEITKLEDKIDLYDLEMPIQTKFIIPGASETSSIIHIARTICRKVEIILIENNFELTLIQYLNRLSDFLFVLSRYYNFKNNFTEINWP